jgi:hypothetical protein
MLRGSVFAVVLLAASNALAGNLLYVDDDGADGFNCTNAPYQTINAALSAAKAGDDIRVCPGTYAEQLLITKSINLQGEAFGTRRAVIKPAALPQTLNTLEGVNPITAAILVDAGLVRIADIDVDLADVDLGACSPMLAGIYYNNTHGSIDRINISNVWTASRPDCESGVAFFVESGPVDFVLGTPIYGQSRVTVKDVTLTNYQKAGFVAHGPKAVALLQRVTATAGAPQAGATVPNGFEVSFDARVKIADSRAEGHQTPSAPAKMGAGILLYNPGKVTVRRDNLMANDVGIFVVGDRARIKRSFCGGQLWDGIVLLGDANRISATEVDGASVSGCFVNGDQNLVRGSFITNTQIGLWFIAGHGNLFFNTNFGNVPLDTRGVFGGVRDLTPATAVPFRVRCTGTLACDDGNECTTDACDTVNGTCSSTPVVDGTACTGGICTAGVCQ